LSEFEGFIGLVTWAKVIMVWFDTNTQSLSAVG